MAAELARGQLEAEGVRVAALRDRLEAGILQRVPGVRVNGDRGRRLPTTANLCFDTVEGEALVIALDLKGVACSTGAACSSGTVEPSHVLVAIGRSPEEARSSVRFSLGRFTTDDDIDCTLEVLPAVVERFRSVTPHANKPVAP
jgi:cysteine desulfurase